MFNFASMFVYMLSERNEPRGSITWYKQMNQESSPIKPCIVSHKNVHTPGLVSRSTLRVVTVLVRDWTNWLPGSESYYVIRTRNRYVKKSRKMVSSYVDITWYSNY